ncbi:alpha/beta hydrolase [Paraliobacillus sediminis]|uniref:alpha/beta hydrolase n=1 Tax=Paraliobacillus sediminis TaxID=1885916 RepID=UPI000E3E6EC2|nr:alpha/beta hydrolase [Paraliobacillus sediminis]
MTETLEINRILEKLSSSDEELDFAKPNHMTSAMKVYQDYYGFNQSNVTFHFGKVAIDQIKVHVQIFKPEHSKGNVFLLHGYLSHIGYLKHIIQYLNKQQYTVISYDLQGHGLSTGKNASVHSFDDYGRTMEKLLTIIRKEIIGPIYLIGHSTGGAIIVDYILRHPDHHIDKAIMVAPLIRSNHWNLSKFGLYTMKLFPFIKHIKRNFRQNSADEKYLKAIKLDPLQSTNVPLEWVNALMNWNKKIQQYHSSKKFIYLIQGNRDKTVDWKYNVQFLQRKFHNIQIAQIDQGRHELFNEAEPIRRIVFEHILTYLES